MTGAAAAAPVTLSRTAAKGLHATAAAPPHSDRPDDTVAARGLGTLNGP